MEALPVIIPVFNRPEYTRVCLDSLTETDPGCLIWPILVDNGSRRRTQELLKNWPEQTIQVPHANLGEPTYIRLDWNKGFAAALNAGLAKALEKNPKAICIMHNDTVVFPGWAGEMKAVLDEAEEEVAAVVPRTNYANEHSMCMPMYRKRFEEIKPDNKVRISPEEIMEIVEKTYPNGKEKVLEELAASPMRSSYSPEIASFCMMVKTEVLKEYPLFDEDFFPRGYEDKLWFLRMERDGYVVSVANRAFVHHFGNITSDGPGFSFPREAQVNRAKFDEKVLELNRKGAKQGMIEDENGVSSQPTQGGNT